MWKTATGRKVKIVDMTDYHLRNTIKMLEQYAKHMEAQAIQAGEEMLAGLHGEIATQMVEDDLDKLYSEGLDPADITPAYEKLVAEADRRCLQLK